MPEWPGGRAWLAGKLAGRGRGQVAGGRVAGWPVAGDRVDGWPWPWPWPRGRVAGWPGGRVAVWPCGRGRGRAMAGMAGN